MKNTRLRHTEYYGMTEVFDSIYEQSNKGEKFKNLMAIITSTDNILLAYRNIKRNNGSATPGIDKVTIYDIEKLDTEEFVNKVRKRFTHYNTRKVKRVEIPKPMGKLDHWEFHQCGTESHNNAFYKSSNQSVSQSFINTVLAFVQIVQQKTLFRQRQGESIQQKCNM
ncbi:hypothetical protein NRIC_12570 [Enterococcus florum]|uniref:Reverse transcriptase domain-containing protein n=1 Tax=Enterococcus florum TaxID=2480627 RepID=A0A4P5P7C5_9ENTE|nr:hypothetical protein NRIC_12570 [Enterococcus florum]